MRLVLTNETLILIFGFGPFPELGIQGAAIATVISYFSIMIAGFWVLGKRERMLTTSWPGVAEILSSWKALLYIGIPAMLTQLLFPISTAVLTHIAADLGEATVAAFGVGTRIESIAMLGSHLRILFRHCSREPAYRRCCFLLVSNFNTSEYSKITPALKSAGNRH